MASLESGTTKMDQEHLDRIEEDYMYLSVCMRENIKRLVKYLAEKKTLDPAQEEDILDEASDTLKSQTLLDYIVDKDEEAFSNLYDGCLHSHMWKAADILEPLKGPHQPREEEIEEFLPENWPTESHFDVIKDPQTLKIIKIGPRHTHMMSLFEGSTNSKDGGCYDMSRKVKGRVLIINNQRFLNGYAERYGSNYDSTGLDFVFSQLSFEIRIEQDLTAEDMRKVMKEEANTKDHSLYNCFILAILSYGFGTKHVLGTDGKVQGGKAEKSIDIEEIKNIFSKVPTLVNKPKVFLINAEPIDFERNAGAGAGIDAYKRPPLEDQILGSSLNIKLPNFDIGKSLGKTLADGFCDGFAETESDGPPLSSSGALAKSAPSGGDVFTAMNTSKGVLVHEKEPCGSWFIQAFIYVMAMYAHQNDILTLMSKVNDLAVQQKDKESVQVCAPVSTLGKKLYFFPGLPIEA